MTPTVLLDGQGQAIFVHDCNAMCGDGIRRMLTAREYVIAVPPWDITSTEPLTMAPSILCRTCEIHGFFREGQWVTA